MKSLLGEPLDFYVHEHTSPRPALLDELREVTYAKTRSPTMQVGRVEGTLLALLVRLARAERVLEIGTFTGYSALCMAEALPASGKLVTCDIDPDAVGIARSFFERSPHGSKIEVRLGDALDTLRAMKEDEAFDLVFLDADKARYVDYYEAVIGRLRSGGLLLADNTLWSGNVLAPRTADDLGICAFNDRVTADTRVENVLLSVRDGLMVARRL